ncbi:MAG: hypothetical protein WC523_06255 [Patescibacteria group bacterium]
MDNQTDPSSFSENSRFKPVVLLLLDGLGIAPLSEANALANAKTPTFLNLIKEYPVALLTTGDKTVNARYLSLGVGRDLTDENIESVVTLTKIISESGLKQIKITETERLAALTHFFNGHEENRVIGEDWRIVSSAAGDHTIKPTLALKRIVKETLKAIDSEIHDFIIVALPTLDLTAASGDFLAAKKAVETVDKNLRKIKAAVLDKNGLLIISSAHGNVEKMRYLGTEAINKEITANPVPLILVGEQFKRKNIGWVDPVGSDLSLLSPAGSLADLAPTILKIMNLAQPEEMSGRSLIDKQ